MCPGLFGLGARQQRWPGLGKLEAHAALHMFCSLRSTLRINSDFVRAAPARRDDDNDDHDEPEAERAPLLPRAPHSFIFDTRPARAALFLSSTPLSFLFEHNRNHKTTPVAPSERCRIRTLPRAASPVPPGQA